MRQSKGHRIVTSSPLAAYSAVVEFHQAIGVPHLDLEAAAPSIVIVNMTSSSLKPYVPAGKSPAVGTTSSRRASHEASRSVIVPARHSAPSVSKRGPQAGRAVPRTASTTARTDSTTSSGRSARMSCPDSVATMCRLSDDIAATASCKGDHCRSSSPFMRPWVRTMVGGRQGRSHRGGRLGSGRGPPHGRRRSRGLASDPPPAGQELFLVRPIDENEPNGLGREQGGKRPNQHPPVREPDEHVGSSTPATPSSA